MPNNKGAAGLAGDGGYFDLTLGVYHARPFDVLEITAALDVLEHETVSAIIAHPARGVAQAAEVGLDPSMIDDESLRLIYAAVVTWGRGDGALSFAKVVLMRSGYWHPGADPDVPGCRGWCDESLVKFATAHWPYPDVRGLARRLVALHDEWADAAEARGPLYVPPPALGQINPIRIGLALARLARWTGIPLAWIHTRFCEICARRDAATVLARGAA